MRWTRKPGAAAKTVATLLLFAGAANAADWARFRGPNGSGIAPGTKVPPAEWSNEKNLRWRVKLPGPGHSCPIVVGDKVFVTCWSGYAVDPSTEGAGDQEDLQRHLICVDRKSGAVKWSRSIDPYLPEDGYRGMFRQHGYASHTPASDGKRVYAFFGKTGVVAFDLDGKRLWQTSVGRGSGMRGWGTASSPVLYKDTVIVTASAESESLVALKKDTGEEAWRQEGFFGGTWGTPILVEAGGRTDLVLGLPREIWGLNPGNGKLRWHCEGINDDYTCSSVIAADGVVYSIGGRSGGALAVRSGGKGNVTNSHVVWSERKQGRIGTPLVYEGRLYWVNGGVMNCVDAETGNSIYKARLIAGSSGGRSDPPSDRDRGERRGRGGGRGFGRGQDYSSLVASAGRLFYLRRSGDVFVVKAGEKFEQLGCNRLEGDDGDFSATPAISDGDLFLRSSKFLYCLAESDAPKK